MLGGSEFVAYKNCQILWATLKPAHPVRSTCGRFYHTGDTCKDEFLVFFFLFFSISQVKCFFFFYFCASKYTGIYARHVRTYHQQSAIQKRAATEINARQKCIFLFRSDFFFLFFRLRRTATTTPTTPTGNSNPVNTPTRIINPTRGPLGLLGWCASARPYVAVHGWALLIANSLCAK